MAASTWERGIDTGVESMDTEHRLLESLVGALDEVVRRREPPLVAKTIGQLADFANVHFLSEELMMRIYAYPQHDAHKADHGRLTQQIEAARRSLEAGDEPAALALIDGLRRSLADHTTSMDQAFALWCAKNDIHPR